MIVCKCDRCGAIFEPYRYWHVRKEVKPNVTQAHDALLKALCPPVIEKIRRACDLCPACMESLMEWWGKGEK